MYKKAFYWNVHIQGFRRKLKLGLYFYNFDIFISNLSFRPHRTQHNEQQKLITKGG